MSYSEFLTKSNILLANGSLNKNYKKIYDKMSSDDKFVIDSSFHEYDDISYKIKAMIAGDYKRCPICETPIKFETRYKSCSSECAKKLKDKTCLDRYGTIHTQQNPEIRAKSIATSMAKYGVDHPIKSKIVQEKVSKTNVERYGVERPLQNKEIHQKTIDTCIDRYGVEHPLQNKEIRQKTIDTCIDRYGDDTVLKIKEFRLKADQTILLKYGVKRPAQNKEVMDKMRQTNIERYGVEYSLQNDNIKSKITSTNVDRYGSEYPLQSHIVRSKIDNNNLKYFQEYIMNKLGVNLPLETVKVLRLHKSVNYTDEYLSALISHALNDITPDLGVLSNQLSNSMYYKTAKRFGYTFDNKSVSNYELIIRKWLDEFGVEYVCSDRSVISPQELDIYIPSHNLAIEFNGYYWHSSDIHDRITKTYHQDKTIRCNDNGITLIHIYEQMFVNNSDAYRYIIQSKLGLNTKIHARKCTMKRASTDEEREFLNTFHLQGYTASKVCYGLYYNDDLVTLCSFGKSRFNKGYEYELLRNCTKGGLTVVGGLTKLINAFKRECYSGDIICYSDASISYNKGGTLTKPNYVWINKGRVYKRYQTMKHKLPKLLGDKFDPNLSESANMINNGYYRIYDSGNYVTIL